MPIPKSQVTPGLPCPVALMGAFPGRHMELPLLPLVQAGRSQTTTLGPSGYLQAVGCWKRDWSTHPQIPSPSKFSSLLGTSLSQPCPQARAPGWGSLPNLSTPTPHRSSELYESTLAVEGVLGEAACTLRLRGQGSYDERYMSPHQL